MFDLSKLQVSTKANTRPQGNYGGSSRVFSDLSFGIKKTKTKQADGSIVEGLKGVFKFSKNFFDKSGVSKHSHSIKYANDVESGKLYILVLEGEGDSCNYNEGKSKNGEKSQEFRSSELERMAIEVGLLPEAQPEGLKEKFSLNKLDVEIAAPYTAVYEVAVDTTAEATSEEEEGEEEGEEEIGEAEAASTEETEVEVATAEANDEFM
jgi:hypothetical protein